MIEFQITDHSRPLNQRVDKLFTAGWGGSLRKGGVKTLVPDHRLVAGPPRRARQQFGDVPLQALVCGDVDGVPHVPLFQRLVDLRLGKGSVATKDHLLTKLLLAPDLQQQ